MQPRESLSALIAKRGIRASFARLASRPNWGGNAYAQHRHVTLTDGKHARAFTYSAGAFHVDPKFPTRNPSVYDVEQYHRRADKWNPDIVDVIASLLVSADSVEYNPTFREFCDDLGMEWDNPADALEAYNACCDAYRFLKRVFGEDYETARDYAREV